MNRRSFLKRAVVWLFLAVIGCRGGRQGQQKKSRRIKVIMLSELREGFTPFSVERVGIFWKDGRLRAVSILCTHQTCLIRKLPGNNAGFECPCHNALFSERGEVLRGPARKPLSWYKVSVLPDGMIEIDKAAVVSADWELKV